MGPMNTRKEPLLPGVFMSSLGVRPVSGFLLENGFGSADLLVFWYASVMMEHESAQFRN